MSQLWNSDKKNIEVETINEELILDSPIKTNNNKKKYIYIVIVIFILIITLLVYLNNNKDSKTENEQQNSNIKEEVPQKDLNIVMNNYGARIEQYIEDYKEHQNGNNLTPEITSIIEETKDLDYEITCDKFEIYRSGDIYLDGCSIDKSIKKYSYGTKKREEINCKLNEYNKLNLANTIGEIIINDINIKGENKKIKIEFDYINNQSTIYLNDKKIGVDYNHYSLPEIKVAENLLFLIIETEEITIEGRENTSNLLVFDGNEKLIFDLSTAVKNITIPKFKDKSQPTFNKTGNSFATYLWIDNSKKTIGFALVTDKGLEACDCDELEIRSIQYEVSYKSNVFNDPKYTYYTMVGEPMGVEEE